METLNMTFPKGYTLDELPKSITLSNPVGEYTVTYKRTKGGLVCTRTMLYKKATVEPEEYSAFKEFFNDALREDNRQILLKK
jgi:hypothetical protein